MATPVDPVAFARTLIRCPSVTPAEGGALTTLKAALEDMGFTGHLVSFSAEGTPDVDNLYARIGTGGRNFCFAGHTDVVPVGDAGAWDDDPFAAVIRDGVLYGRGAADMKAAIAAFTAATSGFLTDNPDFDESISFLITGDEEGPSVNGTVKLLKWADDRGEKFDLCVVGEPTNPNDLGDMIKIGRRGSMNAYLTVHGTQGHIAYPHLADNPIPRLVRMLDALISEPLDEGNAHFDASSLQISTIDVGNPTTNIIPSRAGAVFNIRFNDMHSSASLTDWCRAKLDAVGGKYDFRVEVSGESFITPPGPLSDLMSGAIEDVLGRRPELSTTGGTSDARFIHHYCPVAEFGLIGRTMHKVNEQADVSDIEALAKIYRRMLDRFFRP
ncbi:MAG: succinyl-diaminopimelate desuccinylase [Rhodospirillales bacterium]